MGGRIDLARHLREDDLIVVPQGTAEPLALTRSLVAEEASLPRLRVFLGATYSDTFEHARRLALLSYGGLGRTSRLVASGRCAVVPCHLSALPDLFAGEALRPDVVFLHLSGESRNGRHSVGIVDDYLAAAAAHARVRIAQINPHMPFTPGSTTFALDELDAWVHEDVPLLEVSSAVPDATARAVARNAAVFVTDGSCLQVGIGGIPDALAGELSGRRDLSIHTGLLTDALYRLHCSDAVTNRVKSVHRGVSVAGTVFGTNELYQSLRDDGSLRMRPVHVTHSQASLARIERFVAVNSAVEVDLTGQANSEVAGIRHLGAVGGQVDFLRGAAASPGGRAVIALKSTDRSGRISTIVPELAGGVVTAARSDIDVVVTEYGAAELRGCSLSERRRRLAAVAHPRFRTDLLDSSAANGSGDAVSPRTRHPGGGDER